MPESPFFATISRMKYIDRWALMRATRTENLAEHSLEVSMVAHALATMANVRHGASLNAERAALLGLYHDASEIVTGDMPTPVKYGNDQIRNAYHQVEREARKTLLAQLPDDLRPAYEDLLDSDGEPASEDEEHLHKLVKAADKISALVKCLEEEAAGNTEFSTARASTEATLARMAQKLPEVQEFLDEFVGAYGKTLDELLSPSLPSRE